MRLKLPTACLNFYKSTFFIFLLFVGGLTQSLQAQNCVGPYQNYEGIPAVISTLTTAGWTFSSATAPTLLPSRLQTAESRSGVSVLQVAGAVGRYGVITTPLIQSPVAAPSAPVAFSFYTKIRNLSGGLGHTYTVSYSNDGGTTYTVVPVVATGIITESSQPALSTTWQKVTVSGNFPYTAAGYKFRVTTTMGSTGFVFLDDFAWTSSNPLENKTVVPELGTTVCIPVTVLPAPFYYNFYDNGGGTEVVGAQGDTYSASQNSTVVFKPLNPTDKVKLTFKDYNLTGTGESIVVSDANGVLLTHTGTGMPSTTTFTSTATSGEITVQFISDATGGISTVRGFHIKVESIGCASPSALTATAVTDVGATLNWSGTAPGYQIYYSESNVAPDGTVISATSTGTSHVISTLAGNKTYYAWVRSNCADLTNSSWTGPVTFTTTCAVQNVPYSESFNGLAPNIPNCTSSSDGAWLTTGGNLFVQAANGSTFYTKPIRMDAAKTYRITYDFYSTGGTVNFITYSGVAGNVTDPIIADTAGNGSQTHIANFSPSAAGISVNYVGFKITGFTGSPTFFNLDNLLIVEETCFPPASISEAPSAPAVYSKRVISWPAASPAPANGYQYFVSTSSTPPTYNTTPTGSTAPGVTSVTLTGLGSATEYFVWVRSNCGGQFSVWSDYISFTTANNAATIIRLGNTPTTFTTCNGTFRDDDNNSTTAATGNYRNDLNQVGTIMPSPGQSLKVVFSSFTTEEDFDGLSIYYGSTETEANRYSSGLPAGYNATNCPAGSFYGSRSPGTIYTLPGQGLTFRFRSDYSFRYAGWVASVICVTLPKIDNIAGGIYNNNCGLTTQVVLNGSNFTGATSVTFGGVPATFTVNGAGTQITATIPTGAITGTIKVGNDEVVGTSPFTYTINKPSPVTVGVSICQGSPATPMTTATSCFNYLSNTINGTWSAADLIAKRPVFSTNSSVCSFSTFSDRNYTTFTFQVSVTGLYFFEMTNNNNYDGMGYITTSPFTPGLCGSGTFVVGDDDSGSADDPVMSAVLTAGVTYILHSTTYEDFFFDPGYVYDNYTWTVTPPPGGQLMDQGGQMTWYSAPTGGTVVYTGNSFNPVAAGVLPNTNTPFVHKYYAACSSNSTCRTETIFEIKAKPTVTLTAAGGTACISSSNITAITATGTATTVTWTSTVANTMFTNAAGTIAYVPLANAATIYVKSPSAVTITATGTLAGCTETATTSMNISEAVWNGSWTGTPNFATAVIIKANYTSTGNLSACNLVIMNNAAVTFNAGHTLNLQNGLDIQSGSLLLNNNSSMVQHNNAAVNHGNITYLRETAPIFQYDYTYWSSPVFPQSLTDLSPATRADKYFTYNGADDVWTYINSNNLMEPGIGYIIRAPDILPFNTSTKNVYTGPFIGVPNNGIVPVTISGGADQMHLLGNPYPSAISADEFLDFNDNLDGTIYFWTHGTPLSNNNYTANDYAVYNYMGGTNSNNEATTTNVDGKIATGQGFFVKGLTPGTAYFNNDMRIEGENDQFFRMTSPEQHGIVADTAERHRFWLDITNDQHAYKQALIGYATDATDGVDRKYDGEMIDGSGVSLYTMGGNKKLSIQGFAMPFDTADVIPLGYRSGTAGTYHIALSNFDGLFASQNIYLEDKVLHVIHNLKTSPYSFVTQSGTFEARFVIRYTASTLGVTTPVFGEEAVIAFKNSDKHLVVQSFGHALATVTVFDIQGRQLAQHNAIGAEETQFSNLPETNQILMVKIVSEEGQTVTKKVIY